MNQAAFVAAVKQREETDRTNVGSFIIIHLAELSCSSLPDLYDKLVEKGIEPAEYIADLDGFLGLHAQVRKLHQEGT